MRFIKPLLLWAGGVAIFTLLASISAAQTPPATTPPQETIKIKTDLVLLDAQVTDKKTRAVVRSLGAKDFELYEDGARQEIEYFSQDKLPLSIVLLLDISPSVHPVIEEIRQSALQTLQKLKPEDEVALMVFSGQAELVQDFTKDRELLLKKIEQGLLKDGSGTRIHAAVARAARQFKYATIPGSRRVVIIVTDNQGSLSRRHDEISEAEVRDAVIESNATFCGVIARSLLNVLDGILFQHPAMQEHFKRTSVNPYVELTGGEMAAANRETVNARLGEMIDRLRNTYSLGYTSTNQDYNGKFRKIKLTLTPEARKRLGECVVNARQGYYAIDKLSEAWLAEADAAASSTASVTGQPQNTEAPPANANSTGSVSDRPSNTGALPKAETPPATAAITTAESNPPSSSSAATPPNAARPRRVSAEEKPADPFAHLVMLDVLALNKKTGAAITDLAPEDFDLADNQIKKQLAYFRQGETPLSLVLLVDVAGNTGYALSALRRSAPSWLGKLQPDDEVALMAFRYQARIVQDFTKDRRLIAVKLRNFIEEAAKLDLGSGQERTQAVFQAADQLDKSASPLNRRVIIVLTDDTQAYGSAFTDTASKFLSETGCTVYGLVADGIGPSRKSKVKRAVIESAIFSFGNPISFAIGLGTRLATQTALDAILKDRSFTRLVARSGGTLVRTKDDEPSEQLAVLFGHLHNRYVIGFAPTPHTTGDRYRKLKLNLKPAAQKRAGEAALVTAQGYFARKAEAADSQPANNPIK
jgi:VWFA-related protein